MELGMDGNTVSVLDATPRAGKPHVTVIQGLEVAGSSDSRVDFRSGSTVRDLGSPTCRSLVMKDSALPMRQSGGMLLSKWDGSGAESAPRPDQFSFSKDGDTCPVSKLFADLPCMRASLAQEIEALELAKQQCMHTLDCLQQEAAEWQEQLEDIRKRTASAIDKKAETELLLELHGSLNATKSLGAAVRTIQQNASSKLPEDIKVMVEDCFNPRRGLQQSACVICFTDFTAGDLLSAKTSDRCRHAIHPCGHAMVCGQCAKRLWCTTKKCPMCRADMNRSPKIFKPGRWQLENSIQMGARI